LQLLRRCGWELASVLVLPRYLEDLSLSFHSKSVQVVLAKRRRKQESSHKTDLVHGSFWDHFFCTDPRGACGVDMLAGALPHKNMQVQQQPTAAAI
jgi:hypothetical protein